MADAISVSAPISGTDKTLTFSTGVLAPQSQGAVVAQIGDTQALVTANAASSVREANGLLNRQLAEMPPDLRHARIEQLHTLLVGTVAGWEWARDRGEHHLPAATLADDLTATCVAVLTAPLPEAMRRDGDTGTVITVPAAFNQMQKDATLAAAESAGIGRVALMQAGIWIVSYVLYLVYTSIQIVYDLLPSVLPGERSDQSLLRC